MITYRRAACASLLLLLTLTLPAVAQDQFEFSINPDNTTTITGYSGPGGAVVIPNSLLNVNVGVYQTVTIIGPSAFADNTSLTSVTIPNTVTSIETNAFGFCTGLTNVTIGDGVTNIEDEAFMWTGLINVTNPSSVTVIGAGAFQATPSLTGVYFEGNAPNNGAIIPGTFWNDVNATIYYLAGTQGWAPTVDGLPTKLWTQQTQGSSLTIMGVTKNPFGFTITGSGTQTVVVEASTSLANPTWSPIQTNNLSGGSFYFTDPRGASLPARFYRVRSP